MRSTPLQKNINTIHFQHHQASKHFIIKHFQTLDFKPNVSFYRETWTLNQVPWNLNQPRLFIVKTLDFNPRVFLSQTWILNQVPWNLNQRRLYRENLGF